MVLTILQLASEHLDMAHMLIVKAIGSRLFLAPLEKSKVQRVMDIGTGTGICMSNPRQSVPTLADIVTLRGGGDGRYLPERGGDWQRLERDPADLVRPLRHIISPDMRD